PFLAHCPLPHPHSFPTRRSSDLRRLGRGPRNIHWRLAERVGGAAARSALEESTGAAIRSALREPAAGAAGRIVGCRRAAQTGEPDRKSTRLNSSHQIISYAVFCL